MMSSDMRGVSHGLDEYEETFQSYYGKGTDASGGIKTNAVYRIQIFKYHS